MNYELAKELKDAGFPENVANYSVAGRHGLLFFPTLSELIEACGRIWVGPCELGWHSGFDGHPFSHLDEKRPQGCGATPEEAVARMWLALNKK